MGKLAVGVIAFAAGAAAGALFVRWYVQTHAGSIVAEKVGQALGLSDHGIQVLGGIGSTLDEVRA